jgi:hypothetical protein
VTPITATPEQMFRDIKVTRRDIGYVKRRVGRMVAGRMAVPFLLAAELG